MAAPHRGAGARRWTGREALDARALAALARLVADLAALGVTPLGPGAARAARRAEPCPARPAAHRRGDARRADGDPGAAVSASCSWPACRRGRSRCRRAASRSCPSVTAASSRRAPGLRLPLAGDALDRERYLLYAAVSRATEQVVLSYCSSDEEGNLALPRRSSATCASCSERRGSRAVSDDCWPTWCGRLAGCPHRARAPARRGGGAGAGGRRAARRPRRLGPGALARLRHTEIVSAGALEAYGDCPVRWLVERELDPAALEPEPEPITRGQPDPRRARGAAR